MTPLPLILTYHSISRGPAPLCIDPELFARHLDVIAEEGGGTLTVRELATALRSGDPRPPAVTLTFDDGYADVVDAAVPLLRERGLRATVFCVAGHLGSTSAWPTLPPRAPRLDLARAEALAEVAAEGVVEIGAHGLDHAPLEGGGDGVLERELVEGRRVLEKAVGTAVRTFAYPYGLPPPPPGRRLLESEYDAACAGGLRRLARDPDLYALPRVDAHYLRRPALLRRVLRGDDAYISLRRVGARVRRFAVRDHAAAA